VRSARWSRLLRRPAVAAALGLLLLAPACANTRQNVLQPDGPVARQEGRLWNLVFPIAAFFFFLVMGLVVVIVIKFRERDPDAAPKQLHGNTLLEAGWTAVPAAILAVVGVLTVITVLDINRTPKGPDVIPVTVIGHQWWWEYRYPDHDVVTANEMHIPVGKKISVTLTSADVIHSFWPPKLAGKVDVIPNRKNHMVIEADKPGTYFGQCTEYCGLSHANMRLRVIAQTPADFDAWAKSQAQPGLKPADGTAAADGAALFRNKGCSGCHTVRGYSVGAIGPDLSHFATRGTFAGAIFDRNEQNLRRWLLNPPAEKPMKPDNGLGMPNLHLTNDEITKLIAYLDSLK
jgi:cytochrome c oxidase subunit 2